MWRQCMPLIVVLGFFSGTCQKKKCNDFIWSMYKFSGSWKDKHDLLTIKYYEGETIVYEMSCCCYNTSGFLNQISDITVVLNGSGTYLIPPNRQF